MTSSPQPASSSVTPLRLWPTRFGWAFLGLTALTLIGCINYGLSLGYGLTFLLSAVWVTGAAQARRLARSLSLALHAPAEATAGHPLDFGAQVTQTGGAGRVEVRGVAVQNGREQSVTAGAFLAGGETRRIPLSLTAPQRGLLTLRAELLALDTFGLWLARSRAHAEAGALVAPAPERTPPTPPTLAAAGEGDTGQRMSGSDDFAGLRPYAAGDAPRLISWRHAARTGQLVTREFDAPLGRALALDWAAPAAIPRRGSRGWPPGSLWPAAPRRPFACRCRSARSPSVRVKATSALPCELWRCTRRCLPLPATKNLPSFWRGPPGWVVRRLRRRFPSPCPPRRCNSRCWRWVWRFCRGCCASRSGTVC